MDAHTCLYAALGGHLDVLKLARDHGCPWDELTCRHAVQCLALPGCMAVLRWAREHGAPWDAATRDLATTKGYTDGLPLIP